MPFSEKTLEATSGVDDSTLQKFLGYHLKRAFNVVKADLLQELQRFDLRMLTYTALVLIKDNPGLSQAQLADAMDMERPNLIVIIDELERRDLIVRERVPTDRRAYALAVTSSGRRLCNRATKAVEKHERRLFDHVDEKTSEALVNALSALNDQQNR